MPAAAPLRILLFRHVADAAVAPFEEQIVRAFQGGKDAGGYLATGEDLGVQLELFQTTPPADAPSMLDAFGHTLVIVLVDDALLKEAESQLGDWLAAAWTHVSASEGRHALLAVGMEERQGMRFASLRPALGTLQMQPAQGLGELAIRPAMLALLVLHRCRSLLGRAVERLLGLDRDALRTLRLFISHAKQDGLPLAQSLRALIDSIPWLRSFYDARDLPAGCDWQVELEQGIASSLVVMLRTDVYDSRYWCQQEVRWADEYATPAVLVDARTALSYPAGTLPFERMPSVRIPDGNLTRVLFAALRESVRFLLFVRRVESMKAANALPPYGTLRVFSYPPSMAALLRACRSITGPGGGGANNGLILYPDPTLATGAYEAAQALVASVAPGTRLATPQTLAVTP